MISHLTGALTAVYLNHLPQPGEGSQQGGPGVGAAHSEHGRLADLERVLPPLEGCRDFFFNLLTQLDVGVKEPVQELENK